MIRRRCGGNKAKIGIANSQSGIGEQLSDRVRSKEADRHPVRPGRLGKKVCRDQTARTTHIAKKKPWLTRDIERDMVGENTSLRTVRATGREFPRNVMRFAL